MKCYLRLGVLSCVLFLGVSVAHGQYTYQRFVKEGKMWHMYGRHGENYHYGDHEYDYLMQGDTLIGGEVMKKVHIIDEKYYHDNAPHYLGAVKETGKCVYIIYAGKDNSILLYDFNIESCSSTSPYVLRHDGSDSYASQIEGLFFRQRNSTLRHEQIGRRYYPPDTMEMIAYSVRIDEGLGSVLQMDPFFYNIWGGFVYACYDDGACLYYVMDDEYYEVESTYVSLLKHRRSWSYHDNKSGNETIQTVLGDTLVYDDQYNFRGKLYRKIYVQDSQKYGDTELHYYGGMREEGKKVYLIPEGKGKDDRVLVLNFGLEIGEQVEIDGCTVKVVESNDVEIDGKKRRRLTLHQMEDGKDTGRACHWTEGIGSDCGLIQPLPWDATGDQQLTVTDNDPVIPEPSPETLAIDNPYIKENGSPADIIFDLQGRRLQGEPQKGMYLRNGRKYVRK